MRKLSGFFTCFFCLLLRSWSAVNNEVVHGTGIVFGINGSHKRVCSLYTMLREVAALEETPPLGVQASTAGSTSRGLVTITTSEMSYMDFVSYLLMPRENY